MSIRRQVASKSGIYFITFTCHNWLHLFSKCNAYDLIYQQFDYLKKQGHYICGYVIMPNHVHALIAFKNTGASINTIIGNTKRFLAYEIVKRLQHNNEIELLNVLAAAVTPVDKRRGQLHEIFEPSFDCKECNSPLFINQKLHYMHNNPCAGKWNLSESPAAYAHSSALYYATGEKGVYPVTNFMILQDVNLEG